MDIFRKFTSQRGFSALELISTLSVSLVLMTAGFPAVQNMTASSSMSSAINMIATHLHIARSEAVTRNIRVGICPSSDGQWCLNDFAWHEGIILFLDDNNNVKRDAGEIILRIHQPETSHTKIFTTTGRRSIQFKPSGMLKGFGNTAFTFCDPNERLDPKKVTVVLTGRVRFADDGDSSRCL